MRQGKTNKENTRTIKIKSIRKINEKYDRYDLEVEDNHNYFANNILVHNCRLLTVINGGKVECFSRQGKTFETLDKLKNLIKNSELINYNCVLDGELCIVDDNGNEDFKSIMKQIRRKDHTIENFNYKVFDYISISDFETSKGESNKLSDRYNALLEVYSNTVNSLPEIENYINVIDQHKYSQEEFDNMMNLVKLNGWEGLMLRKNILYEGKRSKNLIKVKTMEDDEFKVVDVIIGTKPYLVEGVMKDLACLSAVVIDLGDGNTVQVGSGFSNDERLLFKLHPDKIIGKNITVQYFEKSEDSNGKPSLRFPVFKSIRIEKE